MFKKCLAVAITVMILAAMCIMPASATGLPELVDNLVYDLDWSAGTPMDMAGTANEITVRKGTVISVYDDEIDMDVADFDPEAQLIIKGEDVQQFTELTYEMYFKITSDADEVDILHLTNSGIDIIAEGEGGTLGIGKGEGYSLASLPRNEWIHVVGSLTKTEQAFYINGVKIVSLTNETTFVGSSSTTYFGEWGNPAGMLVANFRLYNVAVSDEDAAAIYTETTGKTPSAAPSESPSTEPSEGPSADPSTDPSTGTNTQKPSTGNENPTTFDLGIVSLAAVALSSVVAIKKRK